LASNIKLLPAFPKRRFFCSPMSVGSFTNDPTHSIYRAPGAINEFNIHFLVGGKGYVEIDGVVHTLHAGNAFLFFPLEEQRYYSSTDDPWDIRWVHFSGDKLSEFLIEHGFHRSSLWTFHQLKPLEDTYKELYEASRDPTILQETKLSALTYAFLVEFMGHAVAYSPGKSPVTNRIPELLPLMQEQAPQPFDLAYWASLADVSSYYFCKLFRKSTGMTPLQFMTSCRMQFGKQMLLEQPNLPVQQIALETGYSSASYFNKRFMEHEGMTPSQFRELYARREDRS
jgi:AraC-like DNA-binding protein